MYTMNFDPNLSKEEFYKQLLVQINLILENQRNWVTNLANASSLIFYGMNSINAFKGKEINWTGFYIPGEKNGIKLLLLGPFQGKVACSEIKIGRGVCGTAAAARESQVVDDVHVFPGHIACDSGSNSEIVIPILSPEDGALLGILDIDCLVKNAFDEEDKIGFEKICEAIAISCDW